MNKYELYSTAVIGPQPYFPLAQNGYIAFAHLAHLVWLKDMHYNVKRMSYIDYYQDQK